MVWIGEFVWKGEHVKLNFVLSKSNYNLVIYFKNGYFRTPDNENLYGVNILK